MKSWKRKTGDVGQTIYLIKCRTCNRSSHTTNKEMAEHYEYTCPQCRKKTGFPRWKRTWFIKGDAKFYKKVRKQLEEQKLKPCQDKIIKKSWLRKLLDWLF